MVTSVEGVELNGAAAHVYVLGGYTAGLAVIRALGRGGIPVSCVYSTDRETARHSKFLDGAFRSPAPEQERAFLDCLVSLARRRPGSVLIATSDETLGPVARGKGRLNDCFNVACADFACVDVALDKRKTSAFAASCDIPAPQTFTPSSLRELRECAEAVKYPCLVKPTSSYTHFKAFRRKMTKVYTASELVQAWRDAAAAGIDVVLQEFIPGPETAGVNYNAYFRDGEPVAECTARKVRLRPPEIGFPTAVLSEHLPEVVNLGRRVLRSLGLNGFSCTEFKLDDRDGRYKLMEINARPNMSGGLSVACGLDFPRLTYEDVTGNALSSFGRYEEGIYWLDTVADLREGMRRGTVRHPRAFAAAYRAPHVHAVLDADDRRPFAAGLALRGRTLVARAGTSDVPRRLASALSALSNRHAADLHLEEADDAELEEAVEEPLDEARVEVPVRR